QARGKAGSSGGESKGNSGESGGENTKRTDRQHLPEPNQVESVDCFAQQEEHDMTTYSRLQQGRIGVLGGALLMTSLGCSTPLSTHEKGALVGGGTGAGVG